MNLSLRALSLALLAATCVAGCDEGSSSPGTCEDDSACRGGNICAFSFCVDPEALGTVDLEVEPPGPSNLPIQTLLEVDTSSGGRIDMALKPAVNVSGTVVDENDDALAATIFAVPTVGIPGRRRQRSTTTTTGDFSVALVRDQTYRFSALPDAVTLPPAFAADDVIAGTGGRTVLQVQEVKQVRGRIISRVGDGVEITELANCDVFIVDDNNRQLSSIATTGLDGTFTLAVGAVTGQAQLVVRPNNQYPSLTIPVDLGEDDVVDLGDRSLGNNLFTAEISGRVVNADGSAAARAVVVARGDVGAGVVNVRQLADDNGNFAIKVVQGNYAVGAVGESTDPRGGIALTAVDVGVATVGGLVIALPARVRASLTVVSASGEPVAGASVVMTRVGADDTGITEPVLTDAQPTFLASTNERGEVDVDVDPGSYRIGIEPPRGQGTPAFSALITIRSNLRREIVLSTSKILAGTLLNGDDVVGGAFVRIYSRIVDERGQAILLGEALSAPDGSFAVSVPDFQF